jgi:hypothetical protein
MEPSTDLKAIASLSRSRILVRLCKLQHVEQYIKYSYDVHYEILRSEIRSLKGHASASSPEQVLKNVTKQNPK